MNHRPLMSLAAVPVLLVTAAAWGQAPPAAPPPPTTDAPPASTPASGPVSLPAPEPPPPPKPAPPPTGANKFQFTIYGFGQLDIVHDNTNVLGEGAGHAVLPRPPAAGVTFGPAVNGRTNMLGNNSRFGFRLNAPEMQGVKASTVIEADFMGVTANTQEQAQNTRNLRLRHAFVKMESELFDVTAGQTWDVFAGAVSPFLGAGMGFHGILGEVFHRNPQLRLSKIIKSDAVNVEVRAAAVRPVQREAEIPDLQGALRLTLNNWKTVHSFGSGLPVVDGLTLEVSGMYRFFKLNEFAAPSAATVKKNGWGGAVDAWIPIIPATKEDQSNALGVSIQGATGAGIGDMWGITGGITAGATPTGFPNVTDANAMAMPPTAAAPYVPNIDPGIVAYNRDTNQFVLVKWTSLAVGLQYRPAFEDGRLVLSSNNSFITSSNIAELATPTAGYGNGNNIWKSGIRNDFSAMYTFYPATVVGVMYETIQHKYVNVVNGDDKSVRNHRIHFSIIFFF